MDKPISAGDLVVVIKPLECCGAGSVGYIFRVHAMTNELGACCFCGTRDQPGPMAMRANGDICQTWRLKRIPPLSELDGVRSQDERPINIRDQEF